MYIIVLRSRTSPMIANDNHCSNSISTVRHKEGLPPIKLPKTRAQHRQTEPHNKFQTTLSVLQIAKRNHTCRSHTSAKLDKPFRSPWSLSASSHLQPFESAPHGELWNVEVPRKLVHTLMLVD